MRTFRTLAIATLLLPGSALFAASKEQQEMQRDIAQLQDQVRTLQSSVDKNMATLQTLVQQALDVANRSNTSVSVLNSNVTQTLERQLRESLTPVAGLAAKVDNTNNDVAEVRNSVADLTVSINKILQILTDMNNTLKVLQTPPAPPPGSATAPTGGGLSNAVPPAQVMFDNAFRDQNGGKLDLALAEYTDFLKYHPDDPNCASVQFNIGEIHYSQGKLDLAVQDFDAVIERYSDNTKIVPDAYFMKGMALKQSAHSAQAVTTFRALIAKYPHSDKADEAKDQLLALHASAAAPAKKKAVAH
jgi:TolA-binding protein